jgi:hypothetical protein
MDKYSPLLTAFFVALFLAGTVSFLSWAFWIAPGRIRRAVLSRFGPAAIRASVHTSFLYWLLATAVALLLALLLAYLLWIYVGFWLQYALPGSLQWWLATRLSRTAYMLTFAVEGLDYARRLALDVVLGVFAGLLAGAWLGMKIGRIFAARQFLITRAMS